jgi:rhodanese-related sulfurtransferase
MKKIVLILGMGLVFASCASPNNSNATNSEQTSSNANQNSTQTEAQICEAISAAEFKAGIAAGSVQVLDVRTPQETAEGKIDGAIEINFYDNDFKERVAQLDKTIPVYVYCRSGGRSAKAAQVLKELGFAVVYDLKVGFMNY